MTVLLDRPVLVGSTTPRLFTAPLVTGLPGPCGCGCALSPETSEGFRAVAFAQDIVGVTLLPWQRWWLIHALELRPDGTFRFKRVVTLVARQQGKSFLLKVVALYFLYLRGRCLVLGAAQALDIAKEAWQGAVELAEESDALRNEIAPNGIRRANGEQCLTLVDGSRYRIAATTRGAGRGLSVDLLILDELREHRDWLSWGALTNTTRAKPHALIVGISNAGDDQSIVLNSLRAAALSGDAEDLGLFEWSAPDGCDLDDPVAWVASNPALGHGQVTESSIRAAMLTDPPAVFRTETLCQRVDVLDSAIDPAAWADCGDRSAPGLAAIRKRVVACLDVAPDGEHVSLIGAAVQDDGRVRVEPLAAWSSTAEARTALPSLLTRIAPAAFAWFPTGPAAAVAADLRFNSDGSKTLADPYADAPLARIESFELKGAAVGEACQGFADLVMARRLVHPSDPLINAHVAGTARLYSGDGWRFARKGGGHVDAAYASAGAVHVARTLPAPVAKPKWRAY